jgi:hypothetical protein
MQTTIDSTRGDRLALGLAIAAVVVFGVFDVFGVPVLDLVGWILGAFLAELAGWLLS